MATRFTPTPAFQPGGARGAVLPSPFPFGLIFARYTDAAGIHRGLISVTDAPADEPPGPDEVPWSKIWEWSPADPYPTG